MARADNQEKRKPARSGVSLGVTYVDEDVRGALDAYIADHNHSDAEHKASLRSTVEAAIKMYLRAKGHWPPPAPSKQPEPPK